MKPIGRVLMMMAMVLLGIGASTAAAQESVLWSFDYQQGHDGINPSAGLISDTVGNLYGTTEYGGASGSGTVFELSPGTRGVWTEKLLWSFGGESGASPFGRLIFDSAGNLYGTTALGGANEAGTVFELTPGTGGLWTEKTLYSFGTASKDGAGPQAGLIFDSKGNLYGTALSGGANGKGIVFELSPGTDGTWTETILYNFGVTSTDASAPSGSLIFDAQGNLYGTTTQGGNSPARFAGGTVFELSPSTGGVWTEKLLWSFAGYPTDGSGPFAGLIFDSKGNLYGTTKTGGSGSNSMYIGLGAVFELSPAAAGSWTEKVLWNFAGGSSDGNFPVGDLISDAQGNFYSTTIFGGPNNAGTVFALTPEGGGAWTENVLQKFGATGTDGMNPQAGLVSDVEGNLYGTTYYGGADNNDGSIFEIAAVGLPVFSPVAGNYSGTQSVTISSATPDAILFYTTNGATPTTSSTKYTGPIEVSEAETIEAFATIAGSPNSAVASAAYTFQSTAAATPVIAPTGGTYSSTQSVTITDTTAGSTIYYTTNGTAPTTSSTKYTGPIEVSASETIEAIAVASGFSNSAVASAAYVINLPAATPVIAPAGGTYSSAQSVTVTDSTAGATIYYTTNGTTPTASSTVYSGAITVSASETIEAIAVASGFTNSAVASAAYVITLPAAATPVISPAAGTYSSTESVTITDSTAGATIYYTTNGTAPTASSTKYSGAITVSASETVEAIAVASGFSTSAVATSAYVIVVTPPGYTLAANPSSLTIKSGSTGTTVITVTPTGGFTGTVNFSCGTLPTDVTCTFSPASVTVASSGAAPTTTLTVGTSGTASASLRNGPSGTAPNGTLMPEVFVAMILLPLGFTRRILRARKAGGPWLMGLLLVATASLAAAGMIGLAGCGGSGSKGTPPGNYSVPIEVTSGGNTVPLNLAITVD